MKMLSRLTTFEEIKPSLLPVTFGTTLKGDPAQTGYYLHE